MKRKEFKENLFATLNNPVDGMSYDEKMILVHSLLVDYEKDNEEKRDTFNKGGKWTDEELKIILSDAPTKENCVKYARLFKRGYGSIEQIYRWAMTATKEMSEDRKNDSFILQVKRIAKELGIRGQKKLVEAGLVNASGNNRACFYILSSKVYKEQDNIVGYVRQTGIDAVKYEAWIMELIQKQGGRITRDNVVELLNVTLSQAYRLLKKMSDKGRIKLVGNGRSAHYELI